MNKKYNRFMPLFSGAAVQLCIGIIYIWSIFKAPFIDYFSNYISIEYATSCASLTYSIMLASFVAGIITGGYINDKIGPRPIVLTGGIMFASGILLTSLLTLTSPENPWFACLFYGCIAGFGVGAAYTSTIACAQKWFMDKRGFATGIIVCAFGASTVIFTPFVNNLLKTVGLTNTFLTLGVIFLAVILIFVWFIKNPPQEYMDKFVKSSTILTKKQFSPTETLRTKQIYMLILSLAFLTAAYFIINPLFKSLGFSRGLTEAAVIISIQLTGVFSAIGRLVAPWLSDKINRKNTLILLYIITVIAVLSLIFGKNYIFTLLIALVAFAFGGSSGVYAAISADYFGTKNAGANFGLVMIGFAISALIFPSIATAINTDGEPTPLTFMIPAAACIAGIIVTAMLRPPTQSTNK